MYESGYYPSGAQYDSNAPYNSCLPSPESKDIDYSCTLRRAAVVSTRDYVPGYMEKDEDGFAFRDGDNFSETNWVREFNSQYRNPAQHIELLRNTALKLSAGVTPDYSQKFWQAVAHDCENWVIEDEDAEMYD